MRNRYWLCEDARPQKLPVSVSSKIKKSISEIYKHNQNNPTALGQWSEYIEGLISYISNPVIAFDYTNRYAHFPNGAIHLVEMDYDVSFITKSNNANEYMYVYIFDINFKLRDFGLKDPKITENKQHNIMNNTKKRIRLTESQLHKIINVVISQLNESETDENFAHLLNNLEEALVSVRDYLAKCFKGHREYYGWEDPLLGKYLDDIVICISVVSKIAESFGFKRDSDFYQGGSHKLYDPRRS